MTSPIAVILRFNGDSDDLLGRVARARKSWMEAQGDGGNRPAFFAVCKAATGIVIVSGWDAKEHHKAFRKELMPHLHAAGVSRPAAHEQLEIARLGWHCPS